MSCSAAQQRRINHLVSVISPHVNETARPTPEMTSSQSDDDIVVVSPVRTPITKAKRGGLKDTHPIDLLLTALRGTLERSGISPQEIGDVVIGNVLLKGSGATPFRMAALAAGIPETVPFTTLNRQCSSGLQAFASVAAAIRAGYYDIGIAGGVESMSFSPDMNSVEDLPDSVVESDKALECLVTMGQTSENVAEKYGISRQAQDAFAFESQRRAAQAQKEGRFDAEIVPVHTKLIDKDGKATPVVISKDDGIRVTSAEGLAKLPPAFSPTGTSTAGNSSQVSDGAAAVLVMKRSAARRLNLKPVAKFLSYAVVGVPPAIMGVGPAFAIPAALEKAGLKKEQIDVFEINEAFASQALYCVEKLGLDKAKVNPNGGAIALGHPLGCTGARQIATLVHELKRSNGKYGVISMCIGTGMGAAGVFQLE